MKYVIRDRKYNFCYMFDTKSGQYVRTGILDEQGKDTGKDPFRGSFPHLIDVGIMGHCIHGQTGLCAKAGIGCYQSGMLKTAPNMSVEDFEWICKQCSGKCNQFALGGRGDPDQHEHFQEILEICRNYNIVPNFTTSGYGMTPEIAAICKKYCGAVAVSWYRNTYTTDAIKMLIDAGMKTNIHYVLGKNTIDEALERLEKDDFPEGINAIVFLLHKPVGQGSDQNVLTADDPRVAKFYHLIEQPHPFKVGLDSCSVPGVVNFCKNVEMASVDTCEGGRFSCYIGADLKMTPCSFDQKDEYSVQLDKKKMKIAQAWESKQFEAFRDHLRHSCKECKSQEYCMGGCPIVNSIALCSRPEREHK